MKLVHDLMIQRVRKAAPLLAALALVLTGCGSKADQPAADNTDLSKPGDLFNQPLRSEQPQPEPGTVIAVADGTEITWGEISKEAERALKLAERRVPPERLAQMRGQFLQQATDSLIIKRLLLNQVEKENVTLTDEEIAAARERFTANLPPEITLEQILAQQGVTPEEFEKELRNELRMNKLVESHIDAALEPGEEAIKTFYDEHRAQMQAPEGVVARHILLAFKPDDTAEGKAAKKKQLEEIRQKIVDGADFAAMAAENSDCPSKTRGGVLPRFGRGEMVKPFEDAAFSQEPKVLGPVIETAYGYHIIEVMEHSQAHEMTLDEVRDDVARVLKTQNRQKAVGSYIEELRSKAKIEFPTRPAGGAMAPAAAPAPASTVEPAPAPAAPAAQEAPAEN